MSVASYADREGVGGEFFSGDLERVLLRGIHHVHLRKMESCERTYEGIGRGVVGSELASVGVLDEVALVPRIGSGDAGIEITLGSREVEVGRDPVPTGMEGYILGLATTGSEDDAITVATIDKAVGKEDIPVGREVVHLTGGGLPEAEMNLLAVHLFIAEDGEVHAGLIGDPVEVHIRHAYALIIIERDHFVFGVSIEDLSDLDLSAERHVIRELAGLWFVVGALRNDLHLDQQRCGQALVIGQIDHMVVQTGFEVRGGRESNHLASLRLECALCCRGSEPCRQVVNGILTRHAGLVEN